MKVQKISGKVVKRGRKWLKIVQEGRNEKYPEDLLINSVTANFKEGDSFKDLFVETECESKYTGGYKFTHTATTQEIMKEKEINRWWGYVKKAYDEDKRIYQKGVSKLHEMGCHDYDEEISKMTKDVDISNAIYWIRKNFRENGYIYQKGIETLEKYKCHDYDTEIEEMREDIQKEDDKYKYWNVNAEDNCRIENGKIVIMGGAAIKVLSSYYDDSENSGYPWSIYCYKGIDISTTEEGQRVLAKYKQRKEKEKADRELIKRKASIIRQMESEIRENDILHRAEVSMPKGSIIYDTRTAYGGGECIISDNEYAWYIINNGSDGDDWSRNHIKMGGAGGYGYKCSIKKVQELLTQLQELETNK